MKSKILIFSATYNESKNITLLLNYIEDLNLNLDVLIVDDNSPDKTSDVIKEYSKNKKNIHLIVRDKKSGLDTAHKLAFEYSKNNQYEYLITIDADLTHDPKKIPEFIEELKNTPFVLGSRFVEGGSLDTTGWRRSLSIFGNKFIKIVFGSCILIVSIVIDAKEITIYPIRETESVFSKGDAADDPAFWFNSDKPSKSVVFGTDKKSFIGRKK